MLPKSGSAIVSSRISSSIGTSPVVVSLSWAGIVSGKGGSPP